VDKHCPACEIRYTVAVMKRVNLPIVLLLLNLGLLLGVAWHFWVAPSSPSGGEAAPAPETVSAQSSVPPFKIVKTNILETNTFRWSQLESEDYRAYIQRLRSIGCPEQTIRDLIIADVDKIFAARLHAINPAARPIPYWQSDERDLESSADYRERQRQHREIDFAKRDVLRELLGLDLVAERNKVQGAEDQWGRRLGFLSEEKRTQARMILEQFNEEELALRQKTWEEGEPLTDQDKVRLKELQQQREAAMAGLLNPTELEHYQLALSPLAYQVRDSLFGLNPTEQEYMAVYRFQKAFAEQWPDDTEPTDPQKRLEWEQAKAELQVGLKEKLGAARYAEYLRAQDPDFRQLTIAVARYKLAPGVAAEVFEYKRAFLEERARVVGNRSLTPDQQQAALDAMTVETVQTVRAALGDRALNYYLRSGQGTWLSWVPASP
jgi:hypothetical protein